MDKLPVTPSPHRFLLPKSKNTPKTEAEPLQHQARRPSAPKNLKNPDAVPASSASEIYALKTPTVPNLTSPSNTKIVDPSTQTQKSHNATGTEYGGRTEDGFGVVAESLAIGHENGMNAGTARGRAERARALNAVGGIWKGGESPANSNGEADLPMVKQMQMQTPRASQFKPAPRFRFGSSQRPQEGSPSGAESGANATPQTMKPRWRPTQTPLRQSSRREVAEEKIVDGEEREMLMQEGRESLERQDVDVDGEEYGDLTYSQLDTETPAAKRRRVGGDPVESFSCSQSQHDDVSSYDQGSAEANGVPQADGLESNYGGQNDEEMLYNHDQEPHEVQPPLQDLSRPILSTHHQPATTAPNHSQRPRFILPTSHPPCLSTPQPHSTPKVFATTPHFVVTTPSQASTHHDNVPQFATPFAPVPHFFISTPTYSNPLPDEPQFTKPPKFVRTEEPKPTQPLPEEFSPRKRGQKFVVGGLAGQVRGWLVDLETQHQSSGWIGGRREGKDGEGWLVRMVVDEVGAGKSVGWTIAKGDGLNVILGGEGIREGLEKGREVQRGHVLRIKAPVWGVEVKGVSWGVGTNWKV